MGTSKNNMMTILQLAKTFLAKKFKLKKVGDPFAKVGSTWQESQFKPLVVFWGARSTLRQRLASLLPEYRCAFAFSKTNPQRQLVFLKNNVPTVVVLVSPSLQLPPEVAEFLSKQCTPIIRLSLNLDQNCFTDSIIHFNTQQDYINIL